MKPPSSAWRKDVKTTRPFQASSSKVVENLINSPRTEKASSCFRSEEGAKRFYVISSSISTVRKQGLNLSDSIKGDFTGNFDRVTP
jgi:hypothetical protein